MDFFLTRGFALTACAHLAELRAAVGLLEHGREQGGVVRRHLVAGRLHHGGDVLGGQNGAWKNVPKKNKNIITTRYFEVLFNTTCQIFHF